MNKDKNGFHFLALALLLLVIAVAGISGFRLLSNKADKETLRKLDSSNNTQDEQKAVKDSKSTQQTAVEPEPRPIWQMTGSGWSSLENPPECPAQPIFLSPVDLSLVTSILYPGQYRGGNYKPHGGFRFDNTPNDRINVIAPLDGFVVRGTQYSMGGETQYTFDVMNNCGIMYRFGHLRELSNEFKALLKTWPISGEGDSRTHTISPQVYLKQNTVIATSVGFTKANNTFVDWGVYDFRSKNKASQSANYRSTHSSDSELSWHAICWFDWLPSSDAARIKSLPSSDPNSGKNSDYC